MNKINKQKHYSSLSIFVLTLIGIFYFNVEHSYAFLFSAIAILIKDIVLADEELRSDIKSVSSPGTKVAKKTLWSLKILTIVVASIYLTVIAAIFSIVGQTVSLVLLSLVTITSQVKKR